LLDTIEKSTSPEGEEGEERTTISVDVRIPKMDHFLDTEKPTSPEAEDSTNKSTDNLGKHEEANSEPKPPLPQIRIQMTIETLLRLVTIFPNITKVFVVLQPDDMDTFQGPLILHHPPYEVTVDNIQATGTVAGFLRNYEQGSGDDSNEEIRTWHGWLGNYGENPKRAEYYELDIEDVKKLGRISNVMAMMDMMDRLAKETERLTRIPKMRFMGVRILDQVTSEAGC
jgi:hypothetical protein